MRRLSTGRCEFRCSVMFPNRSLQACVSKPAQVSRSSSTRSIWVDSCVRSPVPAAFDTNAEGDLEIDGCDAVDLVAEHGAPLWVISEATYGPITSDCETLFAACIR